MKKVFCVVMAALLLAGICACVSTETDNQAVDLAHNSRNSLNWAGIYTGVIPAADGPGINVRIVLNENGTYEISYQYIDRGDERFENAGTFTWDASGNVIILDSREFPPYYRAGENRLTQLDMEGKDITGVLAGNYILSKVQNQGSTD